jgi:hypothetical protein
MLTRDNAVAGDIENITENRTRILKLVIKFPFTAPLPEHAALWEAGPAL